MSTWKEIKAQLCDSSANTGDKYMLIKYSWNPKTGDSKEVVSITVESRSNYVPQIGSLVVINRIIEGERLEISGRVRDVWKYETEDEEKIVVFLNI